MMKGKNDDAAHAREDSFLAELIPQVTEHLAERHTGDFDASAGQARFETWLAAHTKEPAAPAKGRAGAGRARQLPPPQGEFTDDVLDKVIARKARAFIADLKPRDHVIATMRWVEGLEQKQIADRLGLNVITVRTSLHRTKKKMRAELGIAAEPQRILTEETT